jgi:hypothetical protein
MIRIEVEEYCHQCLDFTPDVTPPNRMTVWGGDGSENVTWSDTIIKCKYCKRCSSIKRYLEQQMKEEVSG